MISFFNYISARRRLIEVNKTIEAMGGEDEASPMLLAQRDITADEVTYFYYESISSVIYTLIFLVILIAGYGASDAL
jgi:hypothetical protein